MKREKTITAYTCDCCGAEIDNKASASITVRFNDEVRYEWWMCGDYCGECGELLVDAITGAIQMPEREGQAKREHGEDAFEAAWNCQARQGRVRTAS